MTAVEPLTGDDPVEIAGYQLRARTSAPPASPASAKRPSAAAVAPSAGAKKSYAVDSCLVGTWKDAGDVLDNTIEGQPSQFTGKGGNLAVNTDGRITQQFGPETLTATIDGNVWTEVLRGSATMRATTQPWPLGIQPHRRLAGRRLQAVRERHLQRLRPDGAVVRPLPLYLLVRHVADVLVRRHVDI